MINLIKTINTKLLEMYRDDHITFTRDQHNGRTYYRWDILYNRNMGNDKCDKLGDTIRKLCHSNMNKNNLRVNFFRPFINIQFWYYDDQLHNET